MTVALAALVAAVGDLRRSQQRLHQAAAAYAAADQLRRVAPALAAVTAPLRPRTAADLAAMSFAHKPGKVRPYPATTAPGTKPRTVDDDVIRRRGPGQGRGPALS